MPAVSQAERGWLAIHKGKAWMHKHHFDNKGKLPKHVHKHKRFAERVQKDLNK